MSDDGQGVLGAMHLPGVVSAEVVMSGSRKSLEGVVSRMENQARPRGGNVSEEDEGEENEDMDDEEGSMKEEKAPFEKNSFRNPKFWVRWKSVDTPDDCGAGYFVFSGNDCRRFKGTLSSERRGWDNISISGWKAVGMSERDVPFNWNHASVPEEQ